MSRDETKRDDVKIKTSIEAKLQARSDCPIVELFACMQLAQPSTTNKAPNQYRIGFSLLVHIHTAVAAVRCLSIHCFSFRRACTLCLRDVAEHTNFPWNIDCFSSLWSTFIPLTLARSPSLPVSLSLSFCQIDAKRLYAPRNAANKNNANQQTESSTSCIAIHKYNLTHAARTLQHRQLLHVPTEYAFKSSTIHFDFFRVAPKKKKTRKIRFDFIVASFILY